MIEHKGYKGEISVDLDAMILRGRVIGTRDVITFQGSTVEAAKAAFVESVEDYLAFCKERGEEPEKPASGKISLRLDPNLHRNLTMKAAQANISVNTLIQKTLKASISVRLRSGRAKDTRSVQASTGPDTSAASAEKMTRPKIEIISGIPSMPKSRRPKSTA